MKPLTLKEWKSAWLKERRRRRTNQFVQFGLYDSYLLNWMKLQDRIKETPKTD